MRKNLCIGLTILFIMSGMAYSAPVELPSACKGLESIEPSSAEKTNVSAGIEIDFLSERVLDSLEGTATATFYTPKVVFSSQGWDSYITVGQVQNIEYGEGILGDNGKAALEDAFTWGAGISKAFTFETKRPFQIGLDVKYRQAADMDYESVTVGGITYTKDQLGGTAAAKWAEWQVALLLAGKKSNFVPYAGIKYSDVEASAKFTAGGTTYDYGSTNSEEIFGIFAGCSVMPTKQLSIDLQARFIDEEAFTIGMNYMF